jgi:hypothetical protein
MFVKRQLLWLTISDRNIHYQRETMDLAAEDWQKAKKASDGRPPEIFLRQLLKRKIIYRHLDKKTLSRDTILDSGATILS